MPSNAATELAQNASRAVAQVKNAITNAPGPRPQGGVVPAPAPARQNARPPLTKEEEALKECKRAVRTAIMKDCKKNEKTCPMIHSCAQEGFTTPEGKPLVGSKVWPLDRYLTEEEKESINQMRPDTKNYYRQASKCVGREMNKNYGEHYKVCYPGDGAQAQANAKAPTKAQTQANAKAPTKAQAQANAKAPTKAQTQTQANAKAPKAQAQANAKAPKAQAQANAKAPSKAKAV